MSSVLSFSLALLVSSRIAASSILGGTVKTATKDPFDYGVDVSTQIHGHLDYKTFQVARLFCLLRLPYIFEKANVFRVNDIQK